MAVHFFERDRLTATPWKNGGGVTQEIACYPAHADSHGFDWRLSIAHIASDGDFSVFPGVDRVITLLEGGGVQLSSPSGQIDHALNTPLAPFAFPGEAPVLARLLGPDCHDLNVMTRRSVCQAHVSLLTAGTLMLPASAGMLLAMRGRWQVHAMAPDSATPQTFTLLARSGLWWSGQPLAWQCHDTDPTLESDLLAVWITPAEATEANARP